MSYDFKRYIVDKHRKKLEEIKLCFKYRVLPFTVETAENIVRMAMLEIYFVLFCRLRLSCFMNGSTYGLADLIKPFNSLFNVNFHVYIGCIVNAN